MTEQELIELVQNKTPDELTVEEIDELRDNIGSSHDLRETLAGQLVLDQGLGHTLGQVNISIDKILIAAASGAVLPAAPSPLLGWSLGLGISLVLSSVLILAIVAPAPEAMQVDPLPKLTDTPDPTIKPEGELPSPSPSDEPLPHVPVDDGQGKEKAKPEDPLSGAQAAVDPKQVPTTDPAKVPVATKAPPAVDTERAEQEAWDRSAEKLPFDQVALDDFGVGQGTLVNGQSGGNRPDKALLAMFSPVPGQQGKTWSQANVWGGLEGVLKFAPRWRKGAVLRLALNDEDRVRLHFWNGKQGVTLQYYRNNRQAWAAYGATRKEAEPLPATLALWATDNDRYRRSRAGTFELRHQDGQLIMSRGDLRLLSVPLEHPPAEIIFEGRAVVRGISLFHGAPLPAEEKPASQFVLRSNQPARMGWKKELPTGSAWKQLPEGGVELSAAKTATLAWAALPLAELGLYEFLFEVENPRPGSGIYLGDGRGRPLHQVGFFKEARTGRTSFGLLRPNEIRVDSNHDLLIEPAPYAGNRQWLRLVAGPGVLKCWTSGDSVHWSLPFEPLKGNVEAAVSHVGLYCLPGEAPRGIQLRQIQVRELSMSSLVPAEIFDKAPAVTVPPTLGQWLREVAATVPLGVDAGQWRRACALRTLASGPSTGLGKSLLSNLLEDGLATAPLAAGLRLLDDIALLSDAKEPADALRLAQHYERFGQRMFREGDTRPYTTVAPSLLTAPVWVQDKWPTMPESLVRAELLSHVYADRWDDVWLICRRVNFYSQGNELNGRAPEQREEYSKLVDWAYASGLSRWVAKHPWLKQRGTESLSMPTAWRHPLLEQLSKEGYNILAEFEAALGGEAYQDACQIITSSSTYGALGLLPDAKDPHLLVSLPAAVALAMRDSPGLMRAMQEQYGKIGQLRVRQAIAEANPLEVEAATVQFYGTEAAAEAHLWLGDRALASGDFAHAIGHYRQLLPTASPARRAEIAARRRLAGALMGRDVGEPIKETIDFGGQAFAPAAFENLVLELQQSRAASFASIATSDPESAAAAALAPPPTRFETKPWARFAGNPGQVAGAPPPRSNDWAAQQLGVAFTANTMLVSNRFELVAYDLANGKQQWNQLLGTQPGRTYDWPLLPLRPVVAGDRVFCRRLSKDGLEMVCLNPKDGKQIWSTRPGESVICDPIAVQDELYALTATSQQNRVLQIYFSTYDPRSGQLLSKQPLVQFRDAWDHQIPCQAVRVDDKIIATLGGTVLCMDLLGQARWLRRQTWLPPSQDPRYFQQGHDLPLVADGAVYVTQPGVRSVECLDLETGRLRWQQVVPDVTRLVGMVSEHLIVGTSTGLEALRADDGRRQWQRPLPDLQWAQLHGGPGGLLVSRSEPVDGVQSRVLLTWLDPATGRETARRPLVDLVHQRPMFGPLVVYQKRTWGFFGRDEREPVREIFELVASGSLPGAAAVSGPATVSSTVWADELPDVVREAAADVAPGWTLLDSVVDKSAGFRGTWQGAADVLVTASTPQRTVRWTRQVSLPAGRKAALVLQVGHDPADQWVVDVRVGGKLLASQRLEASGTANGWKQWRVDLSPYAGQTISLFVEQRDVEAARVLSYWKQLEVVE